MCPYPPQNQHLWRKGLKVPLFSTLTKNRGRGVAIDRLALFASPFREPRSTNPLFSTTCALFAHSFAQSGKSSAFFSMVCALFAKTWGVYPNYSLPRRLFPRGQTGTHFLSSTASPKYSFFPLWTLCLCGNSLFPFLPCRRIDPRAQPLYS